MLNRIVLIGRLTRDPELRYTGEGTPVATFTIAVDRRKTRDGEKAADFIPIVCWRQSAEFASNYLTKGRLVAVDGRLQIREYTDRDNVRRWATEVIADSVQGLDRPKTDGFSAPAAPGPAEEEAPPAAGEYPDFESYDDPFQDE